MSDIEKINKLLATGSGELALKQAKRLASRTKTPIVLDLLARAYQSQGDSTRALATFDRIAAIAPRHVKPLADKAHYLQTLGRRDDAEPVLRRALKLETESGSLLRLLSISSKLNATDPDVVRVRAAWDQGRLPPEQKIEAGYALFAALGADGLSYLSEGNAEQKRAAPSTFAERYREMAFLRSAYDARPWPTPKRQTNATPLFITGMPRSGTTLVEQILASHSTVKGTGETGLPVRAAFSVLQQGTRFRHLSKLNPDEYSLIGQRYVDGMAQIHKATGTYTDKSITTYLVAGILKDLIPNAKMIYVRRDPRDIGWSIWRNHFKVGTHRYANDQRDIARQIKAVTEMVSYWRAQDPDMFIEVSYEALVRDPGREIPALLAACDLPMEEACLHPERNTRSVQTLSIEQVRQPISPKSIGGWRAYADHLAPMIETLKALDVPWD